MLSDRIAKLFALLQCSNTDIARFAGCSPSNISRLKSGGREPRPKSRSIARLADGVYGYADYENMLSVLCELCGTEDRRPEALIPAIISWLYGTKDFDIPQTVTPKSKRAQGRRRQSFGEKLDRVMALLDLSNVQLAAPLNIDASLVSRYRSGTHAPHGNRQITARLSEVLFSRAKKQGRLTALAALCSAAPETFDAETLLEWLCDTAEEDEPSALAKMLLRSINAFTPGQEPPIAVPEAPQVPELPRYWGTDGLRSAVIRFLSDAAREGGELLLYSDEPMEWLSGSPEYFAVWASLMVSCVKNSVRIRIIHNIDRNAPEMIDAINGWLPLYVSGMIEPYVFRRTRNPRFSHTMFLRPGKAAVIGSFPTEAGDNRWYDYITDELLLTALRADFDTMLTHAELFLKTYTAAQSDAFRRFCETQPGKNAFLLTGPSAVTMPEELLERLLSRAEPDIPRRESLLSFYRTMRRQFSEYLDTGSIDELLCLPDREALLRGDVRVNLGPELTALSVAYTPEEYAEHIAALRKLIANEKNYHLTLLPFAPFRDMQIFTAKDAAVVLRCREPHTAFVFTNAMLTRSVEDYFLSLRKQYAADRYSTIQALDRLCT